MPEADVEYLTVRSWGAAGKVTEYRHPVNNYRLFRRTELEVLRQRLIHPEATQTIKRKTT